MGKMMKWMIAGCILVLLIVPFVWPSLGIQAYNGWLFFGLIFVLCCLPMLLMMNRKNNHNINHKNDLQ